MTVQRQWFVSFCMTILATAMLGTGCAHRQPASGRPPHLRGSTLFRDDRLEVTVGPQSDSVRADDPKAYQPIIENVTFIVDGADVDLPTQIDGGWGKGGWYRWVNFTAPEGAQKIEAQLHVLYDGRPFEMTTVFERRINPTLNPRVKWHAVHSDVVGLEE